MDHDAMVLDEEAWHRDQAVLITEARAWVADCVWGEDAEALEELSDEEIVAGVEHHYVGGWSAFVQDGAA